MVTKNITLNLRTKIIQLTAAVFPHITCQSEGLACGVPEGVKLAQSSQKEFEI